MEGDQAVFLFDDVRVEPAAYKVWKAGAVVPLEPKAFEVLLFLIRERGRVVRKRELLDEIWKDAFVSENALTREIAQLRKALGEDARRARYIETVPTRGYRFIAEVENAWAGRNGAAPTDGVSAGGAAPSAAAYEHAARAESHAALPSPSTPAASTSTPATHTPRTPTFAVKAPGEKRRALFLTALATLAFLVCASAGLVFWKLRAVGPTVGVRRLTQVTTSTGLDTFPAISPDGGYVAFSSNRGGRFEIYVRALAPGGREIQITSDGGNNFQPAWSPDGQFLAYYSQKRGGVWLVPAMGGVARRLTDFGSKPAWSPDGRQVAFQSGALQDLIGVQNGPLPPSTLWVVPARGGPARQLTKAGVPQGGHGQPVWWPDGKHILFVAYDVTFEEFWSVSVETGELKKHGDGVPFGDIVFSPDGKYVYVSGIIRGSSYGLWRIPVNLETGEPTGEAEKVEGTGSTPIHNLSISADGRRIAYGTQWLMSDIWQLPLSPSAGKPAGQPAPLFEDTSRRKTNPAVSPDGRRIAFGVWRMGTPGSVWIVDADGQNPTQLTTDDAGSGVPNWLPDGERLAYVTSRQHHQAFWTRNLKTGDEALLAELPEEMSFPRLSPDGRRIAYNLRRDGRINVWTQAVGGGEPRQLTSERELAGFPCWSPDGRFVASEVKRGDDMQVFVMPAEGGEAVQLTHEPGLSWSHSFSPEGDRVAFAGMREGVWNLYWVSRTTGEQRQLTHFTKTNAYVRYPTWSPAGDRLVFEHAEAAGNVWLMELK